MRPRPSTFYKFRTYDSKRADQLKWVRETIFENRIRYSRTSELNDPFEGRPLLVPINSDPVAQRRVMRDYLLQQFIDEGKSRPDAELSATLTAAMSPASRGDLTPAYSIALAKTIEENFWLYCGCGTREPILMWSHYADGPRGVALHFDASAAPFDAAYEVHYSETYPEFPFPISTADADDEKVRAMILTKSCGWSYEEEHRAVRGANIQSEEQRPIRERGLRWSGQVVELPPETLTGVTIGANMPRELAEALIAEIAERRPHLQIWNAAVSQSRYQLTFEQVR